MLLLWRRCDSRWRSWGNWIVGSEIGRCRRWEMPKMGDAGDGRCRRWEMPGFEIAGIRSWGIASVGLLRSQVVTEPPTNPRPPATRCLEVCGMTSSCATLWLAGTGTEIRTTGRARTPLECFRQRTTSLFPSQQVNSRRPSCECRLPDPRAEIRELEKGKGRVGEDRAEGVGGPMVEYDMPVDD